MEDRKGNTVIVPVTMRWKRWLADEIIEQMTVKLTSPDFGWRRISSSPLELTTKRESAKLEDFEALKGQQFILLLFGGDGSREMAVALAKMGIRILFVESTHDYKSYVEPMARLGFQSGLSAILPVLREQLEAGKRLLIVPGKYRYGLALWAQRALAREHEGLVFVKTLNGVGVALRHKRRVLTSEAIALELVEGPPPKSVTKIDIPGLLRKQGILEHEDHAFRITGGELELLEPIVTEGEHAMVQCIAALGTEVAAMSMEELDLHWPSGYGRTYSNGGYVVNLSDAALARLRGHF